MGFGAALGPPVGPTAQQSTCSRVALYLLLSITCITLVVDIAGRYDTAGAALSRRWGAHLGYPPLQRGARAGLASQQLQLLLTGGGAVPPLPPPLLGEEDQQRGITYYGSGARLRALAAKLLAGRPIRAYVVGGSVTFGHGVEDSRLCFASRFFSAVNATFPHR